LYGIVENLFIKAEIHEEIYGFTILAKIILIICQRKSI